MNWVRKGDTDIALFHEGRNYRMHGPLAPGEHVGMCLVQREQATAIVQREACATNGESRSEADARKIALDERHHVALTIDDTEIRRAVIGAGRHAGLHVAVRLTGVYQFRALGGEFLRPHSIVERERMAIMIRQEMTIIVNNGR